ncbi:MAG: 50S ribosomal protein L11 methyltransferase [Desulfuromonadaceae bacterium]|nr:50S ribosomal protein L11 methyltransferase [Desulfuromonas sp.]MDY0185401.1 50S ribosomal protein L11 methyltransferase [Desulfuromonadaceae bacterium]
MTENWYEISCTIPVACTDAVCEVMVEMGSSGVIVDERKLDTFIVPDPDEISSDTYVIKAFFSANVPVDPLLAAVHTRVLSEVPELRDASIHLAWRQIGNQDWAEGWKQYFTAVRIGKKLVIKPSWEQTQFDDAVTVTLDPGMAFGTGTHGTTRLCLEFIAHLHDSGHAARRILDVGTGSGILAIAGAALGAECVIACDIDPVAVQTAQDNAALNGCADRIEVTLDLVQDIGGTFDLVVANILAEENVRLISELCARVAPGGYLVLSGILDEKVGYVTAAFSPRFATPAAIDYAEEWACIKYRRTT